MRLVRYDVQDGCNPTEVEDVRKPRWVAYSEAEKQLMAVVDAVNSRMGQCVKTAWFETRHPLLEIRLLYADATMVSGLLRNGALDREITGITTRFGYCVAKIETNLATLRTGEEPAMNISLVKVGEEFKPFRPSRTSAARIKENPAQKKVKPRAESTKKVKKTIRKVGK